jgi:hypothetical protein
VLPRYKVIYTKINLSNSVELLTDNAEDNTEPSLEIRRCNDYPAREYIQVNGKGRHPIEYRMKI